MSVKEGITEVKEKAFLMPKFAESNDACYNIFCHSMFSLGITHYFQHYYKENWEYARGRE